MTDPQAEAVAALAPILYAHSLESDEYGPWADISQTAGDEAREWTEAILDAIQQDQAAQAALVAVLAPPSPEPLDVERPPEELEAEAGRLLVASARARKARMGPSDAHELRHLLACLEAGNSDPCNGGTACTLDAALANTEPAPEGEPHPDQAALVAVLAPPSPEPLDAELRASAIMVAIAQERERLRVAVEGLHTEAAVGIGGLHYRVKVVAKADVLALLSPDTGATTGGES